jgi:hypothetical protein
LELADLRRDHETIEESERATVSASWGGGKAKGTFASILVGTLNLQPPDLVSHVVALIGYEPIGVRRFATRNPGLVSADLHGAMRVEPICPDLDAHGS